MITEENYIQQTHKKKIMKRIVRLTEKDITNLVRKVISEQTDSIYRPTWVGGTEGKRGPGPGGVEEKTKSYTVNMDGSLFQNGIDKIDTNSDAFKKGVTAISNVITQTSISGEKTPSIQIIGGASAVGQNRGYDNKGLAQRRANNFYDIIKNKFPSVNFTVGQPVVGTSTEKNSAAANAEQFVKLVVSGTKTNLNMIPSRDNTAVNLNIGPNKRKENIPVEKRWIVCFEIGDSEYQKIKDKKNILSAKPKS